MRMISIILFIFLSSNTYGQKSTTIKSTDTIRQVTVIGYKPPIEKSIEQTIDSNIQKWYSNSNLQQLLQLHSNVFVKNYGVSTLSTISIRGSSAAQTAVRWHGININNAITGITDFSTIPVSLFDEYSIQYGSQASNNSLSGGLNLGNKSPTFTKRTQVALAVGYESIENKNISSTCILSSSKISNTLKINYLQGNNRYCFYNEDQDRQDTLDHAHQIQLGILNDFNFKCSPNQIISLHSWLQKSTRQIPPTTFENYSAKNENIESFRNILDWKINQLGPFSFQTKIGLLLENYTYEDSLIFLKTNASLISVPLDIRSTYRINHRQWASLELIANHAQLRGPSQASLNRAGLLASYSIDRIFKRINLKTSLQYEVTDVFNLPIAGSILANMKLFSKLHFYSSFSRNYRMPTLNELYYNPGGNIQLEPEIAKNIEGGFQFKHYNPRLSIEADQNVYYRKVDNWIVWYGNAILTPHNILGVNSRGLETNLSFKYQLKTPKYNPQIELIEVEVVNRSIKPNPILTFNLLYAYTLSTTQASHLPNDYSIGKQLPYVPRYQLKINPGYQNANWDIQYIYAYTGYRFVTTDESQWLLPYSTSNIFVSYRLPLMAHQAIRATIRVQNLFSETYQGIIGRTMPGRNYTFGLLYQFH